MVIEKRKRNQNLGSSVSKIDQKVKYNFDISILADSNMTKDELKNVLYEFYTKELQEKYGVVGIRLELIK